MTQLSTTIAWPPPYKIKKHRKARHVRLRTTKLNGLIITVPYRFNLKELPSILEENKDWITNHLLQIESQRSQALPQEIKLGALNQTWAIHYMPCDAKFEMLERPSYEIVLLGRLPDSQVCKQKLISWIKKRANLHLIAELQLISQKIQLGYSNVIIRDQQTRWGSCTASKTISLNYKLLFLPYYLMQHVLIHELCHTKCLNHSEKFWQLVEMFDPNWREHREELRRADKYIPAWI